MTKRQQMSLHQRKQNSAGGAHTPEIGSRLASTLSDLTSAFKEWDDLVRDEKVLIANHPDELRRSRTEELLKGLQNQLNDLS